jgi:outer membrane protein assembly factor BamD (BamD/ComL family)
LYDTAQLEEKQFNKPHAEKLYRRIVEEYPDSPYASQAKTRLAELEKLR